MWYVRGMCCKKNAAKSKSVHAIFGCDELDEMHKYLEVKITTNQRRKFEKKKRKVLSCKCRDL